jgi:MFS family permease
MSDPDATESRLSADPLASIPSSHPPGPPGPPRRRRTGVDVGVLRRSRDLRLLLSGQLVSSTGSMITYVALPYQTYRLTHSTLVVGLLGLAELAPLLVTALVGGALADARDRRKMVLRTEVASVVITALLVVNSSLGRPRVWPLFVLSALFATVDGLQRPSLNGLLPRVVDRADLPAAIALSSAESQFAVIAGPALGGVVIAGLGLPAAYGIDVVSFAASLTAMLLLRASPAPPDAAPASLRSVAEGWRYARTRPELLGTYLVDINAMLFGMPTAVLPAFALQFGGPRVLGLLYAAPSLGALIASLLSGWTASVHRHGRAICLSAMVWGAAIAGFGLAHQLWLALVLLAVAGAGDGVSGLFRQRMWTETIPDELRGRLAGIEMLSYSIGPLLGDVEAGGVASATSVRFSIASGGILSVAGTVVVAALLPAFVRYDARHHGQTVARTTS